ALCVRPAWRTAASPWHAGARVRFPQSQPQNPETRQSEAHTPAPSATDARLYTVSWDGGSALALIFSGSRPERAAVAATIAEPAPTAEPLLAEPQPAGHADAEELGAI